jgi:hypothetical protein
MCTRMIAFYIVAMSMGTLRNALFVNSIDSIVEKMTMTIRTATEEMMSLKRCFGTFLLFSFEALICKQKGVRIIAIAQRDA